MPNTTGCICHSQTPQVSYYGLFLAYGSCKNCEISVVLNRYLHILSYKIPDFVLTHLDLHNKEIRKIVFWRPEAISSRNRFHAMGFCKVFVFLIQEVGRGENDMNYFLVSGRPFHSMFNTGRLSTGPCWIIIIDLELSLNWWCCEFSPIILFPYKIWWKVRNEYARGSSPETRWYFKNINPLFMYYCIPWPFYFLSYNYFVFFF